MLFSAFLHICESIRLSILYNMHTQKAYIFIDFKLKIATTRILTKDKYDSSIKHTNISLF